MLILSQWGYSFSPQVCYIDTVRTCELYLLGVVIPVPLCLVTEDKIQHKGCAKDIKGAAVPVAMMGQIVLRHLKQKKGKGGRCCSQHSIEAGYSSTSNVQLYQSP